MHFLKIERMYFLNLGMKGLRENINVPMLTHHACLADFSERQYQHIQFDVQGFDCGRNVYN